MELYQKRVLDEKRALDEKITKLDAFINTETFHQIPLDERNVLQKQLAVMRQYSDVLRERIVLF